MFKKSLLIFNTLRYLKLKQIIYQVIYRLNKPKGLSAYLDLGCSEKVNKLYFILDPPVYNSYNPSKNEFSFLNLNYKLDGNWEYQEFGKLWNYNLQYLNYIHQKNLSFEVKIEFVESIYKALLDNRIQLEPYPSSLRAINVLRFLNDKSDFSGRKNILENLYGELTFVSKRLEFHLLANHLLENLFSLLMGGAFFNNLKWVHKAESLIKFQLNEQILSDGAHFELSPMYHQIILFRILELIDWYRKWEGRKNDFLEFLKEKGNLMLGWLEKMTFSNGEIPYFNDSTKGIAFSSNLLIRYGSLLGLKPFELPQLTSSGYRVYNLGNYECKIDVGPIGASYQPGHAHADMLNFALNIGNKAIIVDNGISTYEMGERRNFERGTISHNTVTIRNSNQSQIWGGFRVGKRAKIHIDEETKNLIKASHDGYKANYGTTHSRVFKFETDKIVIIDELLGHKPETGDAIARFYFDSCCFSNGGAAIPSFISFFEHINVTLVPYSLSDGYNKFKSSYFLEVKFDNKLVTIIDTNKIK